MLKEQSSLLEVMIDYMQTELNPQQVVLTPETSLIETGLIDSLSLFKLILFVEETFMIQIQPEDITVENFETLNTLNTLVQNKLQGKV